MPTLWFKALELLALAAAVPISALYGYYRFSTASSSRPNVYKGIGRMLASRIGAITATFRDFSSGQYLIDPARHSPFKTPSMNQTRSCHVLVYPAKQAPSPLAFIHPAVYESRPLFFPVLFNGPVADDQRRT